MRFLSDNSISNRTLRRHFDHRRGLQGLYSLAIAACGQAVYLSLYFKTHRAKYYELLQKVRTEGDWESWIRFFLTGVKETGDQAAATATRVLQLFETDRQHIQAIGKPAGTALRVHHFIEKKPLTTVQAAARALDLTEPTIRSSFQHLAKLGIVREVSGRQRGQIFAYQSYVRILNEGTETNPRNP